MGSAATAPAMQLGLSMFGTGMQMHSSHAEARAANQAAEYNALLMERNAEIAKARAADALARGETEAKLIGMEGERTQGEQRVGYAKAGVKVDEGSALDMQVNTAIWADYNQRMSKANAAKEAWGYENDAENHRQQAAITRATKRAPMAAAAAYGVSGATSAWRQYSEYKYK